jgi:hypothetical protein
MNYVYFRFVSDSVENCRPVGLFGTCMTLTLPCIIFKPETIT